VNIMKSGVVCNLHLSVTENGDIVWESKDKSHSFINNFAYLIQHGMDAQSNSDWRSISNGAYPASNYGGAIGYNGCVLAGMYIIGVVNDTTRGIIAGTSNTPFSVSQYDLQSPIVNGTGSGQMTYAAMAVSPAYPTFSSPDILLEVNRDMANNSGSAITIREIGLKGYPSYVTLGAFYPKIEVLFLRDVVADTVVNAGQVLNVKYILKTVVA